ITEAASLVWLALRLRLSPPRDAFAYANDNHLPVMDTLWQDTTFALRAFSRRPTLSLLVVVTFGLGVGAATAMYSIVDAVLMRPIDAPEPERIASIYPTFPTWRTNERLSAYWDHGTFTWPAYIEYRGKQQSFAAVGAYALRRDNFLDGTSPEQVDIGLATPELFDILGVHAFVGRLFAPDDPDDVVVLAYDFWSSRFGGSDGVIGKKVTLGGRAYTIVGVLPPRFELARWRGTSRTIDAAVWRPIVPDGSEQYGPRNGFLTAIGRLRPGVTVAQADAEAARLIPIAMVAQTITTGGRVVPRIEDQSAPFREPLLILVGASVMLLVAACTSVAAMLLGAGIDREAELSVRASLGAARGRLVRQLVTEGVLLGGVGGSFGILLSTVVLRFLISLAPAQMPGLANASIDLRVLGVALLVSLVFALLFTIAPALALSRVNLVGSAVNPRVARRTRGGLQQTLIVGELALATVLLLGAGLLTKTMHRLETVDPGFVPNGLLTVRVAPMYTRFQDDHDRAGLRRRVAAYFEQLSSALRAVPGVQEVAIAGVLPFSGDAGSNDVKPEGVIPKPGESMDAERRPVSSNYFDVMRMRIVAGRGFTADDDRAGVPGVVVVNEEMVRKYWPGQSAVGKRLGFWNEEWIVVGVVRDTRESNLRGERSTKFYVPGRRLSSGDGSFVIRTTGDPMQIANAIRPALWSIDPALPVTQIMSMRQRMGESIHEQQYRMRLMLAFSALATLFAVAGVYGVLSRSVARRRRELGIRAALGAVRRDVIVLLLRQGVSLAALGLSIGLLVGYFGTRVLESMLYETQRNDPLTLMAIATIVLGLTLVAAWAPAHRAAAIEPMEVLRGD
ncbi:MAG TPA: ABC transporter permease, partial [Gemmatimonadaceae bacterium]